MELYEIKIIGFKCLRCNYEWMPNNHKNHPKVCPECNSPYWDRQRKNKVKK